MKLGFLLLDQAPAAQPQGGGMSFFIMLILLFIVMYLFLFLPERKKRKELMKFLESLKAGDPIVTIGGIYGKVVKVEDKTVTIEVDNVNGAKVTLKVDKNSIRKPV